MQGNGYRELSPIGVGVGIGLGLSLSHQIVKPIGGEISVTTRRAQRADQVVPDYDVVPLTRGRDALARLMPEMRGITLYAELSRTAPEPFSEEALRLAIQAVQ